MRARIYPHLSYLLLVAIASTFFSRLAALIPATRTAVFVLYGIAILLCAAASVAMLRYKIDFIPIVIGAGILGLLYKSLHGFS